MSGVRGKLTLGAVLSNRYRIISLIGSGGMGNVYLAEDIKLRGKKWAVKETLHEGDAEQFVHEAEMLTRLSHPSLPHIVDYIAPDAEGYCYIVLDYIQGETLAERFEKSGRTLPTADIISFALQICDIFHYLHSSHEEPLIYRDLKPTNIMVNEQGNVKLIDFGIARRLRADRLEDTMQMGTFGFAAPEQYDGRTDQRTDLFNLGALLYYLFTGGQFAMVGQRLQIERLPQGTQPIIMKLLEANPDKRYATALDLKHELQSIATAQIIAQGSPSKQASSYPTANDQAKKTKIIVVGSLYSGAGSTFMTLSLARALNELGIPHAVMEYAPRSPALHHWLQLNSKPVSSMEAFTVQSIPCMSWTDEHSRWLPAHHNKPLIESMQNHSGLGWIEHLTEQLVLVDVSQHWEEAALSTLCASAQMICLVADQQLAGWHLVSTERRLQLANEWRGAGKELEWVANRDAVFKGRNEWIQSFPWKPSVILPNIGYEAMLEAAWQGTLIHNDSQVLPVLQARLDGLIAKIALHPTEPARGLTRWFRRN